MLKTVSILLIALTFTFAQNINEPIVTSESDIEQNNVQNSNESVTINYESMLSDGSNKKNAGIALISTGAIFMAGTIAYTVLFVVDKEQFGIPLGSTSSGYRSTAFYLNPGIFGVAVAAPCLATGIVNLIKGKNMINDAKKQSSLNVTPYFLYSYSSKTTATGINVKF